MKSNFSKFIYCNHYNSPLLFQFSRQGNDAHTQKFKALQACFNAPIDKFQFLTQTYLTFFC